MLAIAVHNEKQNLQLEHAGGVLEFGRGPQRPGVPRCAIDDASVSRDHLSLEELPGGHVRVTNLSSRARADFGGVTVGVGETREMPLPLRCTIGQTLILITLGPIAAVQDAVTLQSSRPTASPSAPTLEAPARPAPALSSDDFAAEGFQTIAQPILAPRLKSATLPAPELGASPSPEVLTQWMETILALQRSGGEEEEFFDQAARALVGMIGLDVGLVLLRHGNTWKVAARAAREESDDARRPTGREFSQTVLAHVLAERRTFFQDLDLMRSQESIKSVDAVVASPIFRTGDEMAGVLYGMRRSRIRGRSGGTKISSLEAQLVQLLAAAVGTNLARGEAARTRASFEQFFSPELVRHLAADPGLLAGRETMVTILFSDVRSFSKHSEKLGPAAVTEWMNDVLSELSDRVKAEEGVLVDYIGDELMAMWGAPEKQPDQGLRAVRAALAMHECLPALSERWLACLGEPMRIGVGVNSGVAQVGNTGSKAKFKYGPLGNTVNLASRVQGLTKYLRTGLLVTAATREQLDAGFVARRAVRTRVVNIQKPVDLFEVERAGSPARAAFFAEAQAALDALEAGRFADAARLAGTLLTTHPGDGPLMLTLARAAEALLAGGEGFDPVWTPPGK